MKIKPYIALTAFAASMSAFAQVTPPAEQGPQGRRLHSQAERQALRRDVQDFHRGHLASPPSLAGMPAGEPVHRNPLQGEPQAFAPDSERLAKREHVERRRHQGEIREARMERREELQSAKAARLEKKEERRERRRQRAEQGSDTVTQ
jgi:hypothetical protein